jgi:hypothetical protein
MANDVGAKVGAFVGPAVGYGTASNRMIVYAENTGGSDTTTSDSASTVVFTKSRAD